MINNRQKTLKKEYSFSGKGLHTGVYVNMILAPAPVNTGVVFVRTDIGPEAKIEAIVDYVTMTARGTTLQKGDIKVSTIEHILSAFVGLGVDNAYVYIDGPEAPIMDGSAKPFVEAIAPNGFDGGEVGGTIEGVVEQDAPIDYFVVDEEISFVDEKSGSKLVLSPSDDTEVDLVVDYNSKVLGVQQAYFSSKKTNYISEIACCRTFCFFHEIEFMFKNNLIKGGDLDNAIVIAEYEVPQEELDKISTLLNVERVERVPEGYLNNISLRFPNECARHKLLDIMGDFALSGYRIKGKVTAYKSGHAVNTQMAKLIREKKREGICKMSRE